jgi:hypothetical protein
MSAYVALRRYLESRLEDRLQMTFRDIEGVLGRPLPRSARTHRAWWSNNGSNNVMTREWLAAGRITENVDMGSERVTFVRKAPEVDVRYGTAPQSRARFAAEASMAFAFAKAPADLSPRAQEYLAMLSKSVGGDADVLKVALERAAARSARQAIVAKYAGAGLASGGLDSADIVREARDGR